MKYGRKIDKIVNKELNNLISDYLEKKGPFELEYLKIYYNMYVNMSKALGKSRKKANFEKK